LPHQISTRVKLTTTDEAAHLQLRTKNNL